MTFALILLALAVSSLLAAGAWVIDHLLRPVRIPTRFVWGAAMLATIGLVGLGTIRAISAPAVTSGPVLLDAIDVLAVNAALSEATDVARRVLPDWADAALFTGWALSVAIALIYFIGGAVRHRRVMSGAGLEIVAGERVRVSDEFGPAVIGVLSPTVVLPRWLLSRSAHEQALVIAHEREHVAVHDPMLLLAGATAVVLMPWNPVLWWGFSHLRLAMELDCDARVLRAGAPPLVYGTLLLDLTASLPPTRLGAPAFAARPSQLQQRILAMTTRPFSARRRGAAIVAAALTGVVVTVAACSADVNDPLVDASGVPAAAKPRVEQIAVADFYFDFQVEKPVQPLPGLAARYPDILRNAGVEGEVLAQFVVDTSGRVEMESFKVIRKSHDLFEMSVRTALPSMRFTPAEVGGRRVRQLVQQPFVFQIAR